MPYRKDKRTSMITRGCPQTESSSRAPESISLWWLTGAIVTRDWHMGHFKGINEGDIEIDQSISNKVNAVQRSVAQCLNSNGGSANFNEIVEHVSKRWQTLRKRDGLPYHTRIKQAVEDALTSSDVHGLFQLESGSAVEGVWLLISPANDDDQSDGNGSDTEPCAHMELKHVSLADSAAIAVAASNHSLTELHALILEALIIHKGSAHVDQICDHVSLTWGSLRKRDGTPYAVDCRRAVNSSLLKSCNDAPLYKRQHFHNWVLTTHAKAVLAESEVDLSDVKFVSLGNGQDQFKMPDDELSPYEPPSRPESAAGQNTPADNVVASDRIRDDTYEWPRVESEVEHDTENDLAAAMDLTGLQLILLRVLGTIEEGKGMHIEDIHYRVGPHFVNLKKKNGTMYSAETKRATISSLTNNPSPPFFVKINKDPTKWILAPAGLEKLALYKVQAVKMRARKRSQSDSNNEEPDTKSDVESETSKVDAPTKVNTKATGHTENKADAIRRSTSPTSDTPSKRQRKT